MKISSVTKGVLPTLFFLALILPGINDVFNFWEFEQKDENRKFKETLEFDIEKLDVFPEDCETYINDNFAFREPLLNAYHYAKYAHFKVSPHPEKTLVGKDGWYFLANDHAILEGKKNFTENELGYFSKEWRRRKSYFDSLGIKCYWVVAPIKYHVYSDKLPFNVHQQKPRRTVELINSLPQEIKNIVIDPVPLLSSHRHEQKLYYRLDNHWNFRAGQLVVNSILARIKTDFPNAQLYEMPLMEWKAEKHFKGIHTRVLGIDSMHEVDERPFAINAEATIGRRYRFPIPESFPYRSSYELRYVNDSLPNGLRVLIIRDSYGNKVIPFARELFKETVFIFDSWRYELNKDIIEEMQPDLVIYLGLESHLRSYISSYPKK